MNIALVLDQFVPTGGGVEQWTDQFAKALLARGHHVHIVADRFRPGPVPERLRFHQLPKSRSRCERADRAAELLKKLEAECGLDVIHDMGLGWYCDILHPHGGSRPALERANLELEPEWLRPLKSLAISQLPRYRDFRTLARKQYESATTGRGFRRVVAISQRVRNDLENDYDVDSSRVRLSYCGVDLARFHPENRTAHCESWRRRIGIDNDTCLFLFIAHNHRLKGLPVLLSSLAKLKSSGRAVHVAVAGGKASTADRSMIKLKGISDRVTYLGPVDDPAPLYAAADVCVQPTYYDTFNLVVLEAMAAGLPAITTKLAGVAEIISPCVDGEVLHEPNIDALTLAMTRLLDPAVRDRMGRAARAKAEQFPFERNVRELLSLYHEIVAGRKARLAA